MNMRDFKEQVREAKVRGVEEYNRRIRRREKARRSEKRRM